MSFPHCRKANNSGGGNREFILTPFPLPKGWSPSLAVALAAAFAASVSAKTYHVPGDFPAIQACIDAVGDADECLLAPGTYFETIDFMGKAIAVRSSDGADVTTIHATGLESSVLLCVTGEGPRTVLDGFTVTGGMANPCPNRCCSCGGGMVNINSSPTVTNCNFVGNAASEGGGMYILNSFLPVTRSRVKVLYHSVRLTSSKSADDVFTDLRQLSSRDLAPSYASGDATAVGDIMSFDLGGHYDIGQGDFRVKVTQFNNTGRSLVVRTLAGHPLAGWRYCGVNKLPSGDLLVETFSVSHPATIVDDAKLDLAAATGMRLTWQHLLQDITDLSGGFMVLDGNTSLSGRGEPNVNSFYQSVQ